MEKMEKETLLQLAQKTSAKTYKDHSDEEIELAVALAKGVVTLSQVRKAKNHANLNGTYCFLALALRAYLNK